jgi:hypothetical protein
MKIYNWKDCIQDRHKWKNIFEKAKTFNDWSCRAWRRRRYSGLDKWDVTVICFVFLALLIASQKFSLYLQEWDVTLLTKRHGSCQVVCNSPSKLQLGNKVSQQHAGRNGPRNGTEQDKRRGESLLLLSGELRFSG